MGANMTRAMISVTPITANCSSPIGYLKRDLVAIGVRILVAVFLGVGGCSDSYEKQLVRHWGLHEDRCNGRDVLMFRFGAGDFGLAVSRDPGDERNDTVYISNMRTGDPGLEFNCRGRLGQPEVMYSGAPPGGGLGVAWIDLNADGLLDIFCDLEGRKGAAIRVNGEWVHATMRDGKVANGATTDDGSFYVFDLPSRSWLRAPQPTKSGDGPASSRPQR